MKTVDVAQALDVNRLQLIATASTLPLRMDTAYILRHVVTVSRATLWRWISDKKFPRPDVERGNRIRLWKRETITRWLEWIETAATRDQFC